MRQILVLALFLGNPVWAMGHCGALFSHAPSELPPPLFHKSPEPVGWYDRGPNGARFVDSVDGIIKPREGIPAGRFGRLRRWVGERLRRSAPTSDIYRTPDGKHALFIDRYRKPDRTYAERMGAEHREVFVYRLHDDKPPQFVSRSEKAERPSRYRQLVYLSNSHYVVLDRLDLKNLHTRLYVYDLQGNVKAEFSNSSYVDFRDVVISPREDRVAVINDEAIVVFDLRTGKRSFKLEQSSGLLETGESSQTLAFSPDGKKLAVGTARGSSENPETPAARTFLIDAESGELLGTHPGLVVHVDSSGWRTEYSSFVGRIAFDEDGRMHVVFPRRIQYRPSSLGDDPLSIGENPDVQVIDL